MQKHKAQVLRLVQTFHVHITLKLQFEQNLYHSILTDHYVSKIQQAAHSARE